MRNIQTGHGAIALGKEGPARSAKGQPASGYSRGPYLFIYFYAGNYIVLINK
jgi:hypothetical protein